MPSVVPGAVGTAPALSHFPKGLNWGHSMPMNGRTRMNEWVGWGRGEGIGYSVSDGRNDPIVGGEGIPSGWASPGAAFQRKAESQTMGLCS